MQDQRRNVLFETFIAEEQDLSFDWFTEYFQAEQSDRKNKKQDFTPDGIVTLTSLLLGSTISSADICAGTGGLTIKRWSENKDASFYCEEFSDRALPFLLFNLAIRNVNAIVRHGDSLTRNFKVTYELTKSDKFSEIELIDSVVDFKAQTVIMNPPYSLPWKPDKSFIDQPRFKPFGALAPKSKSDYAFLLQGFSQLDDNGTMAIILPHGVLFRGSAEQTIRTKLIEMNYLDAVIGLPEKAFFSTDIPTVILVLRKSRSEKDVLFIDASKECAKKAKNNVIEQRHIDKILDVYRNRKEVDKFSHITKLNEIKENEFNLNIPRYVDTFEPEPVIPLDQIMKEMREIDAQIAHQNQELSVMMNELVGTNPHADSEIKRFAAFFSERVNPNKKSRKRKDVTRGGQLSLL
jgi:type I restriction enzyme M protein